jgi:Protein of unknown function (DUF3592)
MARKPKRKYVPDYRLAWILGVFGTLVFALGAWGTFKGAQTRNWPRAEAEIIDARLTLHERETRDGEKDRSYTFGTHYRYSVDGRTYLGSGTEPYDFGMQNTSGAKKMAEAYPVGARTQVAYNPENAAEAYLMPGPSSFSVIMLGSGVAFCLIALLARRMIRLGPGEDDDDEDAPKGKPKKATRPPVTLDPKIAEFYEKPDSGKS